MNITYYKTLLLQFLPRIVKIGINLVLGTDTGQHNLYQPRTGSEPVLNRYRTGTTRGSTPATKKVLQGFHIWIFHCL